MKTLAQQQEPLPRVSVGPGDVCGWKEHVSSRQPRIVCPEENICGGQPPLKKRDHTGVIDADEMMMMPPTQKIRADCVGVVTPSFTLSPSTSQVPILASTPFDLPIFKSTTSTTAMQDDAKFATEIQEATSSMDDEPVWDDMSDIEESSSFGAHPPMATRKVTLEEDLPNDVFGWFADDDAAKDTKELSPPQAPTDVSLSSGDSSHKLKDCEELLKKPFLQDRPSANKPSLLQDEDTNLRPSVNKLMNVMGGLDEVEIDLEGPVFEDNILDEDGVVHGFGAMLDNPFPASPFTPQPGAAAGGTHLTTLDPLPLSSSSLLMPALKASTSLTLVTPEGGKKPSNAIDLLADVADASVELEETESSDVCLDSENDMSSESESNGGKSEVHGGKSEASWRKKFDQLREFNRENGHCNVPQKYPANPTLGRWVARQKLFMRQCLDAQMGEAVTLPTSKFDINERMKLLRTIGLKASPKRTDSGSGKVPSAFISCRNTKEWDNRFAELLRYKSIHNNCDVPVKSEGEFKSLGRWVTAQRKKYKEFLAGEIGSDNSGLYTSRFTRLEEIGFKLKIGSGKGKGKNTKERKENKTDKGKAKVKKNATQVTPSS